ncbi:hypothetical protein RFI_30406 [Reticulomyxa filosa]|uniref:Deoxyhypusine synthase n=1 Tax=Reticulomyxa filosa TaxID=46433 RepID=X6M065_RETFI|nr:hypothetical protein RFI_30406 [Reticulomyxa filosa]|eukprot:ETO06986.1 hypothetical protein RFI_30406 [Reticulomyxa filosa]
MLSEQRESKGKLVWTPSKLIRRIGKEINDERSVWYWCYKNNIPVFCPGIIDGAIGDILYFLCYEDDGFILDSVQDIRILNNIALSSIRSGVIILGGGIVKHHILNANLLRNGANWSVFINTGYGYDGSDSGADPDEAVSWGKLRLDSRPVKIFAEATTVFPWIVASTFAHSKHKHAAKKPKRALDDAYDILELR